MELLGEPGDFGGQAGEIGPGERGELGIGLAAELPRLAELVFEPGEPLGETNDGREPGVFATERLQLGGIPGDVGIGEGPADFLRPGQSLAESGLHGLRLGRCGRRFGLVPPAEAIHSAGRIHEALLAREVRVALRAHFDVDRRGGGAGLELSFRRRTRR